MFDFHHHGRGRHRGHHGDMRELRDELRRNFRRGAGRPYFGELFGRGRFGPAVRRGEIRSHILKALAEKPMHGYEVIQWLEEQSGGHWRPSAGSVYPTLQQLADEGLVTSTEVDGRRTYTLTEAGTAAAADAPSMSPWEERIDDRNRGLHDLIRQLAAAAIQVDKVGSPRARTEAAKTLEEARKRLYRLLSDDDSDASEDSRAPA